MKIYVTRHGQVDRKAEYLNGDTSLPKKDVVLSELGHEQAVILGKRLKELGFQGKILSSPFVRTMQTAEDIAQQVDCPIIPMGWLHEIVLSQDFVDTFQGYNAEELKKFFTHVDKDAALEFPWWPSQVETEQDVYDRVTKGLKQLTEFHGEDVLLVGHGASAGAVCDLLELRDGGFIWNCSLGMYDTKNPESNFGNDVSFLPKDKITNNGIWGMDIDFDTHYGRLYQIDMPEGLREETSLKVLHIGDTVVITYPFYRQLIRMVKPDIIIHTGDTADEIKVGRIPEVREEYLEKVQIILDVLKESGKKVYWCSGNNDLPEEIHRLAPFIEIVEPDTVLNIEGVDICLTHSKEQITKKADIYLYGHGHRAKTAEEEQHMEGSDALYLNVCWGTHTLILPEKKFYQIPRPKWAFYEAPYKKDRLI